MNGNTASVVVGERITLINEDPCVGVWKLGNPDRIGSLEGIGEFLIRILGGQI